MKMKTVFYAILIFNIFILSFTNENGFSSSIPTGKDCAEGCIDVAPALLASEECWECGYLFIGGLLQETLPAYYQANKGPHFDIELLLSGTFMVNPGDNDIKTDNKKFSYDGGWGAGLQFSLVFGYFSIDYGATYRVEILNNAIYDENYLNIISQFAGIKIALIGLYFNYNLYYSNLLDKSFNSNFGFAYEIFIPILPVESFNIAPYFRHAITLSKDNIMLKGSALNPHLFELGIKLKFSP